MATDDGPGTTTPMLRVLMIDDDPDAGMLASMHLERTGSFTMIATAGDLQSGLDALRHHAPDVVLLDRRLPDGDTLDHLGVLRATAPTAAFVLLTALPGFVARGAAEDAGIGFIDKLDLAHLPELLTEQLRQIAPPVAAV